MKFKKLILLIFLLGTITLVGCSPNVSKNEEGNNQEVNESPNDLGWIS